MKTLKEGAVNNRRKRKYCAETGQWISFRHWKAHKLALQQIAEAKKNQEAYSNETPIWNPLQNRVREQEKEINDLKQKLHKQMQVLNGYRETLGSAGRLLAALVDVSEIN
jgi:hypothetical protein